MAETLVNTQLLIGGQWRDATGGRTIAVLNPATTEVIGHVAHADKSDLEQAALGAAAGFEAWRSMSAWERFGICPLYTSPSPRD